MDDFFSDDPTLDALPEDELQALEDAAVKSTQQPLQTRNSQHTVHRNQYQQPQYQQTRPDPHTTSRQPPYYNYIKPPPPQLPVGPLQQQQQSKIQQWSSNNSQYKPYNQQNNQLPTPQIHIRKFSPIVPESLPSSDEYGKFDETSELWDSVAPRAQTQILTQDDQQYYGAIGGEVDGGRHFGSNSEARNITENDQVHDNRVGFASGDAVVGVEANIERAHAGNKSGGSSELMELVAKVSELAKENEELQKGIASIRDIVTSKNGEIAVVRANKVKSEAALKEAARQAEQKRIAEGEKDRLHIESLAQELERSKTEILFLRKENEEGSRQSVRNTGRKPGRHQVLAVGGTGDFHSSFGNQNEPQKSPATTPRRNRAYSLRDGFEDSEMLSPSKTKGRSPMKPGIKRKRPLMDSPKMSGHETPTKDLKMMPVDDAQMQLVEEMVMGRLLIEDDRFSFFKAFMAHRSAPGNERCLDSLRKFSFPTSPENSLSSLLQDQITLLQATIDKAEFSAGVCKALLSIWRRCLEESLYGPLKSILNLFEFSILWDQGSKCFKFFDEAVYLLQETIDINAMPMLKRNTELLEEGIDVDICLRLLEGIALGLVGDDNRIKMFWKLIRSDFPLMMLNPCQRLPHIQSMASLLCTSCLGDSFGSVVSNEASQRGNENHLIEAMTKLLVSTPRVASNNPGYTKLEITGLRWQILQFLGCISGMELGLSALAQHQRALIRLIERMADELEEIYECKFGREESVQLVNLAMRLLHGIMKVHGQHCMSKIARPSISHKYLVSMTRLAFSEGLSQELGINESTRRFAQEILETTTTPEEAESLEMLFSPITS